MQQIIWTVWCVIAMGAAGPKASDRTFVTFLASQDPMGSAQRAHTFAVFTKVGVDESAGPPKILEAESFTISWLPANGVVRVLALAEPGKNYTFAETIAWAGKQGMQTTAWGPYEISKDGFDRAAAQYQRLQKGGIAYKAFDRLQRPHTTNCIHAVSEIVSGPRLDTGTGRGNDATQMVVRHFRSLLIEPERVHRSVREKAIPSAEVRFVD